MSSSLLLRAGASGPQVLELQKMLQQQGFLDASEVDGIFGKYTERVVRKFQAKNGLPVDGIAGPDTLAKLERLEFDAGWNEESFESQDKASHQKHQQKHPDISSFGEDNATANSKQEKEVEFQERSAELNEEADEKHVKRYWLFQYKPDADGHDADWLASAKKGEPVPWRINRYRKEMQPGDVFFLWRAFKDADERSHNREGSGIVGRGEITHLDFEEMRSESETAKNDIRLSLPVNDWLDPIISRDAVAEYFSSEAFPFLRSSQGTIFKVPIQVAEKFNELIAERISQAGSPDLLSNETVIRSDQPSSHDSFNRFAFAEYMARWLDRLWHEEINPNKTVSKGTEIVGDSFVLHLCGRWGAGKTTFMYQLDQCLCDKEKVKQPWIPVHFNAWRNQHIDPPWWGLLDRIISKGIERSGNPNELRKKNYWHRIGNGDKQPMILIGALIITVLLVALAGDNGVVKSMVAIFALGGITMGFLSKCMPGFAASAQLFQRLSSDPMEKIRSYYSDMVDEFDRPIIVFIDDLDRCKSAYVISLLESLHTLYSHPKVFFLVAADRHWISACFEEGYETFGGKIAEVEQPTGYRFLEKLFQLSIALPPISPELKAMYMDEMTSKDRRDPAEPESFDAAFSAFEKDIQDVSSESELNEYMRKEAESPVHKQAMIAAAVIKASKTESFTVSNRHRLTRFVDLMDANPRSMKLIVNAFGVYVNLARVSGILDMDEAFLDQVALWTILEIRFPRVAEYLERHPDQVHIFVKDSMSEAEQKKYNIPPYLMVLIGHSSLQKIAGGCELANGNTIPPLTTKAVDVLVNAGQWTP